MYECFHSAVFNLRLEVWGRNWSTHYLNKPKTVACTTKRKSLSTEDSDSGEGPHCLRAESTACLTLYDGPACRGEELGSTFSALILGDKGHNNLVGLGSFDHAPSGVKPQDIRLGGKHLLPECHLTCPLSCPQRMYFVNLNISNFVSQIIPC